MKVLYKQLHSLTADDNYILFPCIRLALYLKAEENTWDCEFMWCIHILQKIIFSETSDMHVHMSGPQDRDKQKLELRANHSSATLSSIPPILVKYAT